MTAPRCLTTPAPAGISNKPRLCRCGSSSESSRRSTGTHPHADRALDLYDTPPIAVEALLAAERLPHLLWEPAAGRGAITKVLRDAGHGVISSDIHQYDHPLHFVRDFLPVTTAPVGVGANVTNPPFKIVNAF